MPPFISGGDVALKRAKNIVHIFIVFILTILFFSPIVSSAEEQYKQELNYVALGDSLAEGYLAEPDEDGNKIGDGYPVFIEQGIKEEYDLTVNITNAGIGGYRTDDVYEDLTENKDNVMDSVEEAEIVTLSAGANDVIQDVGIENIATFDPNNPEEVEEIKNIAKDTIEAVETNTEEILRIIKPENEGASIYVLGYYNALPHLPEDKQEVIVPIIHELNDAIQNATEDYGETYIPTFDSIAEKNKEYLPNPIDIHPTVEGYQVIGDLFLESILPTIDVVAPEITLNGDNPVEFMQGGKFVDPGVEAVDDVDGELTDFVEITDDINMNIPGEYKVTYQVSDSSGNGTTETRKVIVLKDKKAPIISLNDGNPMELEVGEKYEEPGATAEDNVDGNLTDEIEVTGNVDTGEVGNYTVTYTVSDAAGNEAIKERQVKIVPKEEKTESDDRLNQGNSDNDDDDPDKVKKTNDDHSDKNDTNNSTGAGPNGDDTNNSNKGETPSGLSTNKGDMLPYTASNIPLFILIGCMMIAVGGAVLFIRRKIVNKDII